MHIQCGGGPVPPLRPPSCRPPPSWPAQPERTAELQSPARGQPPPRFLGVGKCRKNPVEIVGALNARRNLVREMGPECRCAVRNATATRVGVRAARWVHNLHGQPAAGRDAPRGRAARDGRKRRRIGVRCACTDGGRVHYACGRGACVAHPSVRCIVQVGRAVHVFGSCCATRPTQADG